MQKTGDEVIVSNSTNFVSNRKYESFETFIVLFTVSIRFQETISAYTILKLFKVFSV